MTKAKAKPARPWARANAARRVLTTDPEWAASAILKLSASCHTKQAAAVEDPARFISLLVPRGAGKTTAALAKLLRRMMRKKKARCLFLALTKESAARIVWEEAKTTLEALGVEARISEAKKTITLVKNGSTLELGGVDDLHEIDKYRGVTFHAVVIDEGAAHSPKLLAMLVDEVLAPRLQGWLMLVGTAGRKLGGAFYDATRPGSDYHRPYAERTQAKWKGVERKWSSHHWTLADGAKEVPAIAELWAEAQRTKEVEGWSDTNPKWKREYLAQWASDDTDMVYHYRPVVDEEMARPPPVGRGLTLGALWNQWKPKKSGPMQVAELPAGLGDWHYVYAFDKGLANAFAVNVYAFSPRDSLRRTFHVYGFESPTIMTARGLASLFLGTLDDKPEQPRHPDKATGLFGVTGWPAGMVGDIDESFLKELSDVYFVFAKKAEKKEEAKASAIEEVNGDLYDGRILVLEGSKLEEQLTQLQWKRDEYGAVHEDKGQANHSTDTLIYARKVIARLWESGAVGADNAAEPPDRRSGRAPARPQDDDEDDEGPASGWVSAADTEWSDPSEFGNGWGDE